MNIYNYSTVSEFFKIHPGSRIPLEDWYSATASAMSEMPNDVIKDFNTADILKNNRVVFNIGGNNYRLIAEIYYAKRWLFILFIGTHAVYSKIDANTVNLYKRKG